MADKQILFLGCGKMGSAIIKNLLENNFNSSSFLVIKPTKNNLISNIRYISNYKQLPKYYKADIIFFTFKPQGATLILNNLLKERPYSSTTIFVSILAGKRISFYENILGSNKKIIRIMPNLPIMIGEGICSYCHNSNIKKSEITYLLKALGKSVKLDQEEFIDAATAVAGSGPAYLFLFIKVIIDSARKLGLSKRTATKLVKQTIYGSAKMALEINQPIEKLIENVVSKGGTTQVALKVLTRNNNMSNMMIEAINSACNQSKILANKNDEKS